MFTRNSYAPRNPFLREFFQNFEQAFAAVRSPLMTLAIVGCISSLYLLASTPFWGVIYALSNPQAHVLASLFVSFVIVVAIVRRPEHRHIRQALNDDLARHAPMLAREIRMWRVRQRVRQVIHDIPAVQIAW